MARLSWNDLLCTARLSDGEAPPDDSPPPAWQVAMRTPAESDYDRILYATPTRRMADKTQVFPLDPNTSIRTRLTHSHEVSTLARSLGLQLAHVFLPSLGVQEALPVDYARTIPAMLAAIGLVHDIGNPPFGHSGEDAISGWFAQRISSDADFARQFAAIARPDDFLKFEGNAQTLRLVTKLQVATRAHGLNLTLGTLAAAMKYTVGSQATDTARAASKKYGFFLTEQKEANQILAGAGLAEGQRHPLAVIMEACDDIAYTVLDTEDTVKKQLVSFQDVMAALEKRKQDPLVAYVLARALADYALQQQLDLSPSELDDVAMQRFRVYAINAMICNVYNAFTGQYEAIMQNDFAGELIAHSPAAALRDTLKEFDSIHAYGHVSTLKLQSEGRQVLQELMDQLWIGVTEHDTGSSFADTAYSRISENHRRQFRLDTSVPLFYRQCRLLTDMVSGMSDGYAVTLRQELAALQRQAAA